MATYISEDEAFGKKTGPVNSVGYISEQEAFGKKGPTTFEAKVAKDAKEETSIVDRVTGAIKELISGPGSVMD